MNFAQTDIFCHLKCIKLLQGRVNAGAIATFAQLASYSFKSCVWCCSSVSISLDKGTSGSGRVTPTSPRSSTSPLTPEESWPSPCQSPSPRAPSPVQNGHTQVGALYFQGQSFVQLYDYDLKLISINILIKVAFVPVLFAQWPWLKGPRTVTSLETAFSGQMCAKKRSGLQSFKKVF